MLSIPIQIVDFLPKDLDSRLLMPENVAFKSTVAEFLAFAEICEYRIEFHEGFIISFHENIFGLMANHETLVLNFLVIVKNFYKKYQISHRLFPSNLVVYIHSDLPSVYKPDAVIFKEKMEIITYSDSKSATQKAYKNPNAVFEVLSRSTRNFDLTEKLENYKKISSLEQIIFAEQRKFEITIYDKINNFWIKTVYTDPKDVFFAADCSVLMADLYENVDFDGE
ncbi:MAG: Uma2 family endonuclease [Bacteroidetes bacterium]|nr:MAG: Uma2 family endonuclease [Bacteroidota bacterium]